VDAPRLMVVLLDVVPVRNVRVTHAGSIRAPSAGRHAHVHALKPQTRSAEGREIERLIQGAVLLIEDLDVD
jgi:hypothetical protein